MVGLRTMPTTQRRVGRYPEHPFHIRHQPWQVQPFMIAPVVPGETLKNLLFQSRAVTDPIKNGLIGWHLEYWWFYVKHTDLIDVAEDLKEMHLNMDKDLSALYAAADVSTYHYGGTINWTKRALDRVIEEYFRNEAEDTSTYEINGIPISAVNLKNWTDSLSLPTEVTPPEITVGVDDKINAAEVDAMMRQWEFLRDHNLTDKTYEDYLADFGIRKTTVESHRPELLRYVREWSYPANTIDPTSGAPTAAVSWAVSARADKDRFFKEPGFIIGLTCARPKVYMRNLKGSAVGMMVDAISWLPAIMRDDPSTSLRLVPDGSGPLLTLPNPATEYLVDIRDIFVHGDQFVNFDTAATDANMVDLPLATLAKRYADADDANALFSQFGTTPALNKIRQDGITKLTIMGTQVDHT